MKKVYILLMSLLSLFIVSCSNLDIGFEEDSMFYSGGVLYIYLDDEKAKDGAYKVYINHEDTEVYLANHFKTRFGITPGQTNIEVVYGSQKASIDIFLQASNNYYLKVKKNNENKVDLVQVQKDELAADAQESGLYIDDKSKEKTPKDNESESVKIKTKKEQTVTKIDSKESVKESSTETTFSYDKNDGWE